MSPLRDDINTHYAGRPLIEHVLGVLREGGKDIDNLTREDLFMIDEFHIGGIAATRELAALADLKQGMHVLDIGCGVGGPARTLAAEFDCTVTGIDLTEEYCRLAEVLTSRVGMAGQVSFQDADATRLPFDDNSFDAVWTQHMSMNVEDKHALYRQASRVLKPGGTLAIHEICEGARQPVVFPVPWAADESISFLATPELLCEMVVNSGCEMKVWNDVTADGLAFFLKVKQRIDARKFPAISISLISGGDFPEKALNMVRNLEECRIKVVQGVFGKRT
jgi:SAM-dependent methyltransferase